MQSLTRFSVLIASLFSISATALAETPNLQPGLWEYTSTTTMEGPMNFPPQTASNQECLTQAQLDKGQDVINMPEECDITQSDIKRDRVDYAASCNMDGMTTIFKGYANFKGNRIEGKMTSEMNTPIGPVNMKTDYSGERIGECSP
ncbi:MULTISPECIES: DUF3617 family protein [unclassified Methylophaga]|jgi:hypothetical protein|uniref:DUF3617 domain-containing protein n=1 Tax=unclassified Methylophaga TaxID=2629249 RepID=UPI000C908E23|nr:MULTISPECIES: DUF3617 family protein [unclassified Methylophaga]MAK67802.1 hypothetical protein [Methylophaga sp.]MAY18483.1 hypothetical protein [Methylophaga sp.]MBN45888.1 hypothetical protein [Methylophaga sp.]HAO24005.1 hypothetical protein [Methylophaga sp.]HCD04980.1 hypothetical protein [Methylophaga sp.]|tara:strand:+ start:15769 stop:16206 length:438 start_codon:yes stop_codon:yes gene_type:complete